MQNKNMLVLNNPTNISDWEQANRSAIVAPSDIENLALPANNAKASENLITTIQTSYGI